MTALSPGRSPTRRTTRAAPQRATLAAWTPAADPADELLGPMAFTDAAGRWGAACADCEQPLMPIGAGDGADAFAAVLDHIGNCPVAPGHRPRWDGPRMNPTTAVEVRRAAGGTTVHLLTEVFSGGEQLIHARVACAEVGLWRRVQPGDRLRVGRHGMRRCDRCEVAIVRAEREPALPGLGGDTA